VSYSNQSDSSNANTTNTNTVWWLLTRNAKPIAVMKETQLSSRVLFKEEATNVLCPSCYTQLVFVLVLDFGPAVVICALLGLCFLLGSRDRYFKTPHVLDGKVGSIYINAQKAPFGRHFV
jgi:hypothetical protein